MVLTQKWEYRNADFESQYVFLPVSLCCSFLLHKDYNNIIGQWCPWKRPSVGLLSLCQLCVLYHSPGGKGPFPPYYTEVGCLTFLEMCRMKSNPERPCFVKRRCSANYSASKKQYEKLNSKHPGSHMNECSTGENMSSRRVNLCDSQ